MVPGETVYGEKKISVEEGEKKIEYRAWNPFRSKLAAAILGGVDNIHMKPGSKVLYLGAASGTTVSHVSDIVGPEGLVYAVEFSHRSGRDLINVAKKRTNIIPIIEDARHPHKYRMLVGMVDTIFADVAQPDQARIVAINAHNFLKNTGHIVISIKANCIDSTAEPEAVFAGELNKLKQEKIKPQEQLTLEPYERDHAVVVGIYRPPAKKWYLMTAKNIHLDNKSPILKTLYQDQLCLEKGTWITKTVLTVERSYCTDTHVKCVFMYEDIAHTTIQIIKFYYIIWILVTDMHTFTAPIHDLHDWLVWYIVFIVI